MTEAQTIGVVCPLCEGVTGVLYRKMPPNHITRRRQCGRCGLRVTTREAIVINPSAEDLERAALELARWCRKSPEAGELFLKKHFRRKAR